MVISRMAEELKASVGLSNRKKLHERFLFEQFANATGLQHEIVDSENEAPDLLIRLNGELVGVEVTELFVSDGRTGNSLQAREALAAKIVQKAQSLFEQKGAPYAHVSVHFSSSTDLAKLKRDHQALGMKTPAEAYALAG